MSTEPTLPKPTASQLAWHRMEQYAFVHFGPNTFTNREWGEGKEDPKVFAPTQLDARQWARTVRDAGMKGIILTAKHHDGFCLWPSQYSTHTVREAGFKRDVVREVSEACLEFGLKFGVYLSPWDRNHPTYGTPAYNDTFVNTLTEVLTQYGPIFEVWFDGANAEGPNGKKQVYDWPRIIATVRKHQPRAVIFSDAGPDIRWVGNEQGIASETNWNTLQRDRFVPGTPLYRELGEGHADGTHYVPAECDVSIRPGWFYHPEQDEQVRSAENLFDLYEKSVGRGSNLLLNLPVDRRGLVHENDVASLMGWRKMVDSVYRRSVSKAIGEQVVQATQPYDRVLLQEDLRAGQRVKSFVVERQRGNAWTEIARGTTVGYKRIVPVPAGGKSDSIRVRILDQFGQAKLTKVALHASPKVAHDARMKWWREARFGMFIHWGLYAVPAGEWKGKNYPGASEWLMNSAKIPTADWQPLLQRFNPVKYDAKEWVRIAKNAGMKYIVITSKHHEGFALWPSKVGDFHVGRTPYGKDLLKPLAEECRKAGIKLGFYHSILDWHHPDYMPRARWDARPETVANYERYRTFMKTQLRELLTEYPDTAVLWFDGEWDGTWTHAMGQDLYAYVRGLSPNIIVNNRVDKGRSGMAGLTKDGGFVGDFGTPEQEIPGNGLPGVDWESCMTMNGSWGYHAKDENWKSTIELIRNLVDCASKGGNYLLNVGPTGLGEIPPASVERLKGMGEWLKVHGEAVYGTEAGPYTRPPSWGRVTRKGSSLYVHVFDQDAREVTLNGLNGRLVRAAELGGQAVSLAKSGGEWKISTPASKWPVRVYRIDFTGEVEYVAPLPALGASGLAFMAADAETTHGIRYESEKKALGFWTSTEGTVAWPLTVQDRGNYRLTMEFACEDASAGSEVEVTLAGETKRFRIDGTGTWSNFKVMDLGVFALVTPGPAKLKVAVRSMPNGAVMNLRQIRATLVK